MSNLSQANDHTPRWLGIPMIAWTAMGIAIIAESACYAAVGATLGLFFGGIIFAALLVPPLVLAEERLVDRLLIAAAVCDGIAIVWLITIGTITLKQFLFCYILLAAWCAAMMGTATIISGILCGFHLAGREYTPGTPRCNHRGLNGRAIVAAAIVTVIALMWITSPIWFASHLSHSNSDFYISWFAPPHPLLAINGILANLGIWSERPIAYAYLLNLGQDVPYTLPRSVWPCAGFHLLIGTLGAIIGCTLRSTKMIDAMAAANITK
jgi:hypothetical protein